MNSAFQKNSKSFYIALTLAVIAVAAAAIGITFTVRKVKRIPPTTVGSTQQVTVPSTAEKANNVTEGVRDDRTTETETPPETETTQVTTQAVAVTEKAVECVLPIGTDIIKDYSNGLLVESKTMNDWRLHNGVDFAGETGDEIRAVCGGSVTKCYKDALWGNVVEIEHENGMTAKYCGLDEVCVKQGDNVEKEQTIGTLGEIPVESADSIHLHLEVIKDGKTVDPIEALGRENGTE